MVMTLTEAVAVNELARFLLELDVDRDPRGPVLPEEARKALGDLAAAAHKRLGAGTDRERVRAAAWRIDLPMPATPGFDTQAGLERLHDWMVEEGYAYPADEPTPLVNDRPDAGPWVHVTDGSTCDVFLARHPRPSDSKDGCADGEPDLWWCTEHQSHLRSVRDEASGPAG